MTWTRRAFLRAAFAATACGWLGVDVAWRQRDAMAEINDILREVYLEHVRDTLFRDTELLSRLGPRVAGGEPFVFPVRLA